MIIDKIRRRAVIRGRDNGSIDVHFFLQEYADGHSGRELILDVLNSESTFVSLEEVKTKKFILVNKQQIVCVEPEVRDLQDGALFTQETPVTVELYDGRVLQGTFPVELPPERSRLSDHLNLTPPFLYLLREEQDIIVNKSHIFSVWERGAGS